MIDIAGALTASEGLPFEDDTGAVRNLRLVDGFPDEVVGGLTRLPGFRNILIHEYVALDLELVVQALNDLEPIEAFARAVAARLARDAK